jgi:hypothetical protein
VVLSIIVYSGNITVKGTLTKEYVWCLIAGTHLRGCKTRMFPDS